MGSAAAEHDDRVVAVIGSQRNGELPARAQDACHIGKQRQWVGEAESPEDRDNQVSRSWGGGFQTGSCIS
jgi:hypothetical protein